MKVGVFDSGVGGITVLSSLLKKFPGIDYVYLGDTANVPYGSKSPRQIGQLATACAKTMKERGVDVLVVACNTASSWALDSIREVMGETPVYGVVEPGIEAVKAALSEISLDSPQSEEILPVMVLATKATVSSQAYGGVLRRTLDEEKYPVLEQACPLLVPMIEEGWIDHPILKETIDFYVKDFRAEYRRGVALLGCTHYPWIQGAIEAALPGWRVVNSAQAIATALERFFIPATQPFILKAPEVEWIFTDPEAVPEFARKLVQERVL
jgi:glutamate racemase